MSLTVLYGKKYAKGEILSQFGSVIFDTVVTEEHHYSSRVTNFPTEFGTIISDHIVKEPDKVTISGLVTDTPLNIFAVPNRSVSVFNKLVELHARRIPIRLITGIKVYKNMAITLIDVPRNMRTGQTLTFNIEFQKIIFDNTVQVELNEGNIFEGVQDNTPRALVAENNNYPLIQNDPPFSLKDQAESAVSVGVQSLAPVPSAMLPNVLANAAIIARA